MCMKRVNNCFGLNRLTLDACTWIMDFVLHQINKGLMARTGQTHRGMGLVLEDLRVPYGLMERLRE